MNSIKKQLKNIIKEAILDAIGIEKLHQKIDNVARLMNDGEKAQLVSLLVSVLSEFTGKNLLLNKRVNPAND